MESKLETLIEYLEVTQSMRQLVAEPATIPSEEIDVRLRTIAASFRDRQMRWSTVLSTVSGQRGRERRGVDLQVELTFGVFPLPIER